MPTVFYSNSDWEGRSEPYQDVNVQLDDIWPCGAADGRDELEDGMHMFFAVGAKANRPLNVVGVSVTYNDAAERVVLNVADSFVAKAYVCNITGYGGGVANAWAATLAFGDPVYIDDSAEVGLGCTLSRSNQNSAGAINPRAGYVWRMPDEEPDAGVGGGNTDPFPKAFASASDEAWLLVGVMLRSDVY